MAKALRDIAAAKKGAGKALDWRRRMSDNVAYALLAYTGLQIYWTMKALKAGHSTILPYFALVILVAAVIPACRMFESRWDGLSDSEAANPELADRFRRDRIALWVCALGLPFVITAVFKGVTALL